MSDANIVFLQGFKTILRPLEKSTDLRLITMWQNNPANRTYVSHYLPQTMRREEEWFDKLGASDADIQLAIVEKIGGNFIGMIGLHRIEWKNRVAAGGTFIGDIGYRDKGYGTDAKMTLLEYAFHELGLNKVNSAAFASNPRSIAYSMKCGYRVEGRRRQQVFKNGRFGDIVELGVLRSEWEPIWRRWKKTGSVK